VAENSFDSDISKMQKLFDFVKHEYDLYFAGARTEPPSREKAELDRLVRFYGNNPVNRLVQQHVFSSFSNKYNVHNELWNKWLRAKEDGLGVDPRLPAAARRARKALQDLERRAPAAPKPEEGTAAPQPAPQEAKAPKAGGARNLRKLYEEFVNAKVLSGEIPGLDFAAFQEHVRQQREAILQKYEGRDVVFSVKVQNGRVSLRAKVVK
jgi:hypothetical protein